MQIGNSESLIQGGLLGYENLDFRFGKLLNECIEVDIGQGHRMSP